MVALRQVDYVQNRGVRESRELRLPQCVIQTLGYRNWLWGKMDSPNSHNSLHPNLMNNGGGV